MPSNDHHSFSAVRKKRKNVTTKQKKTSQSSASRTVSKPKPQKVKYMPNWFRNLLALVIVICFSTAFYYWFVRPYAYRWKPCQGCKEYGVCIPSGFDVHGIDISHHQGDIDWNRLSQNRNAAIPLYFVFMKATEGGDHSDDRFVENFSAARAHGFIRGAYHFYIPSTDAVKQADFFIQSVALDSGDLPPVLDVEMIGEKEKKEFQRDVKRWLECVESHYGVKPILYTSYKFKERYLNDSAFNVYPYWIAHYYVDSVKYRGRWDFWQHTDVGTVPGIEKEVDLDVFNGTLDELKELTINTKSSCEIE